MQVINTKRKLVDHLSSLGKNRELGLVPTMGALHKGHVSLVEKAVSENALVVVSIFVNPTQFDNQEDLKKYPKTFDKDLKLLEVISDEIIIFAPWVEEIYDNGVQSKSYDFHGLEKVMEGAFREDHFNGVGTIVEALLLVVEPDKVYFGEKDFQQLLIIKKLIKNQDIPVKVIACPIVREPNGLAMSSRNERLTKTLRKEASFIYKTLQAAKQKFGTNSANYVLNWVREQFLKHPDLRLEYVEIADAENLTPVQEKKPNLKYRAFVAVYADEIRLIDNIALN